MGDSTTSSAERNALYAFLDELLDVVAARVAARLAATVTTPTPRYADRDSNPLGSARAFLDAARRGDFKSFVRARKVTALWSDVRAAIERRERRAPARQLGAETDPDRAALVAAGVVLRPANDSRHRRRERK